MGERRILRRVGRERRETTENITIYRQIIVYSAKYTDKLFQSLYNMLNIVTNAVILWVCPDTCMHKMELVLQSLKCAGYEFTSRVVSLGIKAMSMTFRTPTITHTLVDNKKNLNSILQLLFLFQIFIINILIELVFICSPEMLDTADCKKWQQCGNVQSGFGNVLQNGRGNIGVGSACGWLSCYLKYQPVWSHLTLRVYNNR